MNRLLHRTWRHGTNQLEYAEYPSLGMSVYHEVKANINHPQNKTAIARLMYRMTLKWLLGAFVFECASLVQDFPPKS